MVCLNGLTIANVKQIFLKTIFKVIHTLHLNVQLINRLHITQIKTVQKDINKQNKESENEIQWKQIAHETHVCKQSRETRWREATSKNKSSGYQNYLNTRFLRFEEKYNINIIYKTNIKLI